MPDVNVSDLVARIELWVEQVAEHDATFTAESEAFPVLVSTFTEISMQMAARAVPIIMNPAPNPNREHLDGSLEAYRGYRTLNKWRHKFFGDVGRMLQLSNNISGGLERLIATYKPDTDIRLIEDREP